MTNHINIENNRFPRAILAALLAAVTMIILSACGSKPTYTISGNITSSGSGLSGVKVTLGGSSSGTTTTDANGNYTFSDLPADTYTVTPSLPGFALIPPSRTAYLNGTDASGFNFSVTILGKMATATHSVFLKNDSTVWAWGNNGNGQLGVGSTIQETIPVQVSGLSGIMAVSAGNDFTLTLKNDGTVWAWGNNGNGQLGDGSTTQRTAPVQVGGLAGMTIVAVAAGFDHAVALKNDGTVWAWGKNSNGQLGNGATADSATPVQVSGLSGVTAISAGFGYTLALMSDTTVWAWGINSNGQLGNGTTTDSVSPVQVSGLSNVMAISAGYDHTAALKNELTAFSVWTWGKNASGELGNGTVTDSATPVKVSGLSNVTAVAAGFDHTVIVNNDGTVWAWGNNGNGQLGADKATLANSATPVQVSGLSSVMAIAAGNSDTVALKNDGTLLAWGNNSNGQLGNGTTLESATPVQVQL
jgi:alpha-tubulin suppressor-like RCC1 family protein